jgi:hypothetical protein
LHIQLSISTLPASSAYHRKTFGWFSANYRTDLCNVKLDEIIWSIGIQASLFMTQKQKSEKNTIGWPSLSRKEISHYFTSIRYNFVEFILAHLWGIHGGWFGLKTGWLLKLPLWFLFDSCGAIQEWLTCRLRLSLLKWDALNHIKLGCISTQEI